MSAPTLLEEARDELAELARAHAAHRARYPGDRDERQPLHVVYGGAHLYKAGSARRIGEIAREAIERHAGGDLARACGLVLDDALAERVHARVLAKLAKEPVEDQRIDFEDGFGVRSDAVTEAHAARCARDVARGMSDGTLPASIGIRIPALSDAARAVRTLELFVRTLAAEAGALPPRFVVTLPKVAIAEEPRALARMLERLERACGLATGSIAIELMIELPQALVASDGTSALPALLEACDGRCRAMHLGTYDLTAAAGVPAGAQAMDHAIARAALDAMQLALAGRGVWISDGATTTMPVGATDAVRAAWAACARNVRGSLLRGIAQGWDLHPAQIPARLAAVHAAFLEGFEAEAARLRAFLERAAQASRVGVAFDDAATAQALLATILRGVACGAIDEAELAMAGVTMEEARTRSFSRILADRERR